MTKLERTRQIKRRLEFAGCGVVGAMAIGALLFCNSMGSIGDEIPPTEIEAVPVVVETEAEEFEVCCVDIPIVEASEEPVEEMTETIEESSEVETEEINTSPNKKYTEDDVNRLAHLIYAEVGSNKNSDMLLYACGQVVLNRVRSNKYPNSIKAVIAQKNVYSTRNSYMKRKPTERCFRIARELLKGKRVVPDSCYGQSFKRTFQRYGKKCYYKENNVYIYSLKEK